VSNHLSPFFSPLLCIGGILFFASACTEKKIVFEGDPNARDASGKTPLMQTIDSGALDQIRLIAEAGGEIEATDEAGDTALAHAVLKGDLPAVTELLKHGASPAIEVSTGGSLLVKALREKQLAATYLLLRNGARLHQSTGAQGESLVQAAVEMGNLSLLKDLQNRGAHPKADLGNGHGLLHVALDQKQDRVLEHLLNEGLDPNKKNSKKDNLVHRCVREGFHQHLPLLKKNGANFDAADAEGWLPIHLAIQKGNEVMVRSLINAGASVDRFSEHGSNGITPLELAFDNHELGIARQLLEQEVPVNDELFQAVKLGGDRGLAIVDLLIEFNAPLDSAREEDTAVSAVVKEDTSVVELLLMHGADANDPFLPTPSEEFLKFVVSKGVAKWALKKSSSLRPLMIAADSGNVPMAQLLMKNGASPGKSSKVGRHRFWPLSFAARRQDTDLQQVLFGQGPGKTKRWIRVDLSDQKAYVFEGEKTIFTTRISSGKKGNRTPKGKYVISNKYRMWHSTLYDDAEMPYFQRLSGGDFGFHYGILPGYPASHGCIRLPMSSAKKLFRLTRGGDYVEIVK